MDLTFLGGADGIGASCTLVDLGSESLLIDCGQRLGVAQGDALPDFSLIEGGFGPSAVLLTHAHTDHVGGLPALAPFLDDDTPIYGTAATIEVTRVMLEDSIRIMTRHRTGGGRMPMFTREHMVNVLGRLKPVPWQSPQRITDTVRATWYPAGHILGAAMILVEDTSGAGESVLFTGDISVADQQTIPGLHAPSARPDVLVLESTYGNRMHAHRPDQERRLAERVAKTIAAGGNVLFPSFALGRAQEVLIILHRAMREGRLPEVPVYADGMVRSISKTYSRFPEDLSPWARKQSEHGTDPIFPSDLPIRPVYKSRERDTIAAGPPCVVVASSGMLQGGASEFYARQWIGNHDNLIVLTGYQDEESPGGALLGLAEDDREQPRYFQLGGIRTEVKCRVESISLSAHADQTEMVSLASKLDPADIFLVHGDGDARQQLARALMPVVRADVVMPHNGEHFRVDPLPRGGARDERVSPVGEWPPWDPNTARDLDLARIHRWLAAKPLRYVTLEELTEIWRAPQEVAAEDRAAVREAVFTTDQPYFVPHPRRPHMLTIVPTENLASRPEDVRRIGIDHAAAMLRELLPETSGLERFGFFPEDGACRLTFADPGRAESHYRQRLREFGHKTGWRPLIESTDGAPPVVIELPEVEYADDALDGDMAVAG